MLLLLGGLACFTPSCEEVCDHLMTCKGDIAAGSTSAECEESCAAQRDLYDKWTDTSLQGDFDAHLSCVAEATCAALAAGKCYDAHIWSYGESQP